MNRVSVIAPAHLHAGNIDLSGDLGRLYGTIGFTLEEPKLQVYVEKSDRLVSDNPDALRFASRLTRKFGVKKVRVRVQNEIPAYVGLGYHTTLALSVGEAISRVYRLGLSMEEIAMTLKRGLLTAIGLYACKVGGFIVEGGFRKGKVDRMVPPLIFRFDIPKEWNFVIAIPEGPRRKLLKLRKERENRILREVGMPPRMSARLSRLVLMRMLPAIVEKDLQEFGAALTAFNEELGSVWKGYQRGNYCCSVVKEGIEIMKEISPCACQSSWGPTFYGIVDKKREVKRLTKKLREFLRENGGGEVFSTKGRNRGLEVISNGKSSWN